MGNNVMTEIETIVVRLRREAMDLRHASSKYDPRAAATAGLMTEAADMIEAQAREIERLRNPWQPIETAPKDGTRVMLWRGFPEFGEWPEMVIAEWHDYEWQWPDSSHLRGTSSTHGEWTREHLYNGYSSASDFTHWMPLPEPPQ